MKKKLRAIASALVIFGMLISPFGPFNLTQIQHAKATGFSGSGNGQMSSPYRITSCAQLQEISNSPALNYVLAGYIDCTDTVNWNSGAGFLPIDSFSGSIDGRNYTINGLTINSNSNLYGGSGFINHLQGGVVKNIKVTNGSIAFTYSNTSETGFIGEASGSGTLITHVSYAGSITGASYTGGLVGSVKNGAIVSKSSSSGDVYSNGYAGGFVGYVAGGTISDCYTTSYVHEANVNAGFASNMFSTASYTTSIVRSYAAGTLDGHNYAAGFVSQISGDVSPVVFQDIFSVEGKAEDMTSMSGISSFVSGDNITGSNILFDQTMANSPSCVSNGSLGGCTAVNADGTDGNHFKNSSTVAPFKVGDTQTWNFDATWQVTESYPTLRDEVITIYGAGQDGLASGTAYEITTCGQLADANLDLDAYYLLNNDVSCTTSIALIGATSTPFTGHFDGAGHTITLNIDNSTTNFLGLFAYLIDATVSKVRIAGTISGQQYVGGLAGYSAGGSVSQVVNTATITGTGGGVGGLIGNASGTSISDCYNTGNVAGANGIGGIAGDTNGATIVRSYNRGTVGVTSYTGGLVGRADNSQTATVQDSFSVGGVPTYYGNGALIGIGWQGEDTVSHSYYDVSRTGQTICGYVISSGPATAMEGTNCSQMNENWDNLNQFKSNSVASPFYGNGESEIWDFSGGDSVWQVVNGGYPALRSIINDDVVINDEPPGAPIDLRVTSKTTSMVSLAWDTPSTGTVTGYYIEHTPTGTDNWTDRVTRDSDTRTVSFSDYTPNTSYDYRVAAVNSYGQGNWISPVLTVTTNALPDAPGNFTVTQASSSLLVNISWTAPVSLGGDGTGTLTSYELLGGPSGAIEINSSLTSLTDYEITNLAYGTTYNFSMQAVVDYNIYSYATSEVAYTTPAMVINDISSCTDLQNISDLTGSYKLTGQIDCSEFGNFTPIGRGSESEFSGTLDGAGYAINGLTINEPDNADVGLFSIIGNDGVVKNLQITNANVVGNVNIGILAGANTGQIINSFATGTISGTGIVGGLAGSNEGNGQIKNAHFGGTVNATTGSAGGLVGDNSYGNIYNSYSTGNIYGSNTVGGLVGYNIGSIYYSYSTAAVNMIESSEGLNFGGLVGINSNLVWNSFAAGSITGIANIGGLVGYNESEIYKSYSTGAIMGEDNVRGLVGYEDGYSPNSFWNTDTDGGDFESESAVGLTTSEMQTKSFFTDIGWDFQGFWQIDETNQINNGYPYLVWQGMQAADEDNAVAFQGGGTDEFPWLISNASELQFIGRIEDNRSAKIESDFDAAETESWGNGEDGNGFMPIGHNQMGGYSNSTFDGGNHTISNLYINFPNSYGVGLFSLIYNTNIKDLTLSGGSVIGNSDVGALVGEVYGTGSITNIQSSVNVSAVQTGGGLIGGIFNDGDEDSTELITIDKVMSSGTVIGTDIESGYYMGGLIGAIGGEGLSNAQITNSYARGNVVGTVGIGGLIGLYYNKTTSSIDKVYASGTITGTENVGGLIGYWANGSIKNSFAAGLITDDPSYKGGLVGTMGETSYDSFTNNYFDNLEGQNPLDCGVYLEGCEAKNTTAAPIANYAKGTDVNLRAPFDVWNFSSVWQAGTGDYPTFLSAGTSPPSDNTPPDDNIPPIFTTLGSSDTRTINIDEGQTITTNPYIIRVKPTDTGGTISKVEFYVDDVLICTAKVPDSDGVYSCAWDTSKYHSIIKVYAYDNSNNRSAVLLRNTTVDPKLYLIELPATGRK